MRTDSKRSRRYESRESDHTEQSGIQRTPSEQKNNKSRLSSLFRWQKFPSLYVY